MVTTNQEQPIAPVEVVVQNSDKPQQQPRRNGRGARRGNGNWRRNNNQKENSPATVDSPAHPAGNQRNNNNFLRSRGPNPRSFKAYQVAADWLKSRTECRPKLCIVSGSGLGALSGKIEDPQSFSYRDIPGFTTSNVDGHSNELVFGKLGGIEVVAMKGRVHPYEGIPVYKCCYPIRVLKLMGVNTIMLSNAAGGLNKDYKVGDIMLIEDHIDLRGLAGGNPLVGHNLDEFGPRFVGMCRPYDAELRAKAKEILIECSDGDASFVREGVYVSVGGPVYETPAEVRMLRNLGADTVGMSTTHEVVTAIHCGMKVVALSLVTNEAVASINDEPTTSHEEVIAAAKAREPLMMKFAEKFITAIQDEL